MESKKLLLGFFGIFALAMSFVPADVGEYGCGMSGMMFGDYGFGGIFFSWIIGALFIAVLVLLIIWLAKQIQKK